MDVIESTVLQKNHELIINNVSVKESQILTDLLQSGTLTDNEYEDIKGTDYFHFLYKRSKSVQKPICILNYAYAYYNNVQVLDMTDCSPHIWQNKLCSYGNLPVFYLPFLLISAEFLFTPTKSKKHFPKASIEPNRQLIG